MDRDQVNDYMSKNVLKFKKCSENGGAGERVAGQVAASEERAWVSVLQWNQFLGNPRKVGPRQREQQEQRAPHTLPAGCLLHM